jgi:hypothetical protein
MQMLFCAFSFSHGIRVSILPLLSSGFWTVEVGDFAFQVNLRTETSTFAMIRDSPVVIAADYGLDGSGSIPGKGKDFFCSTVSRPAMGPNQPRI